MKINGCFERSVSKFGCMIFHKLRSEVKVIMLVCPKSLSGMPKESIIYELSVDTRMSSILITVSYKHFGELQCGENLRKISKGNNCEISDIRRKNFIFITFSSECLSIQNFIEIQDDHDIAVLI
jgi:hypothetical protein